MKNPIVKPEIRILKIRSCSSRSGKSTLTYHIGCNPEGELQFRIFANSGNGFFNDEWVSLNALLSKASEQFTSYALTPLFRGKSTNTPEFRAIYDLSLNTIKDFFGVHAGEVS